jgi:hypothetical protein
MLVVTWLLIVYLFCLMEAINTMVALNAQQEISSIAAQDHKGSPGSGSNDESAPRGGLSSAKIELEAAMRLRDELRMGDEQKRATLEGKFRAFPPEIQKAAIEAEAGFAEPGVGGYTVNVDIGYVLMPMAMVTLIMSLWMGALGSAIHMTVEFLRKDEAKSGAWYFFRPFYGAILALAVFIVFRAGQIVLTNPVDGGNAELNPYVIAFVAIVSGMLTDQAYRRIGLAGSHLLGAKADEKPRWARPAVVKDKLAGRTAADFAKYMPGTLDATAQEWLDGHKDLSEGEQTLLAAWLDAEPRELFTDQPPAAKGKGSTTDSPRGTTPQQPEEAGSGSGKAGEEPEGTEDPAADQERSGAPEAEPAKRAA